MGIIVKVHANDDDALIAWKIDPWPSDCVGFAVEKRNVKTGEIGWLNNRIPPKPGATASAQAGVESNLSPILRCIWTDHSVDDTDEVQYRVSVVGKGGPGAASDWTDPLTISADDGGGVSGFFNRGTLMSQIVSRFVSGNPTVAALKKLKEELAQPGFPARRYLSGQARHEILSFMADADRRGSEVYAALYEVNDQELIDALKPFGTRGHVLLGNGSGMKDNLAGELQGLEVHHRDLSHKGASSPSVHNKFIVERSVSSGKALRVLTGSTNWTTTGLCTQLNNVLVIDRPAIANRFYDQWRRLTEAGDDMPAALKQENAKWVTDGPVSVAFAATPKEEEFEPVLESIEGADVDGLFFLMFMPGQSPLLDALLKRAEGKVGPYVRGVVSTVTASRNGEIEESNGRVIRSGQEKNVRDSTLLPAGVPADNAPAWEREEFATKMFLAAGLNAIVHSKVIVVNPFSDDCAVIAGSHNFSDSASEKNDENIAIVRGNKALAQAYAVHIQGVYDHYSWRAFLAERGDPNTLYDSLADWKPGGSRARDLEFWIR